MASEGRPQLPDGTSGSRHRVHLLSGLPVTERRLQVAGVSTSVLEGGCCMVPATLLACGCGRFQIW